jgi:hypothetical protein
MQKLELRITIPGNVISKKNGKKIVKCGKFPKLIPSDAHAAWHKTAMDEFMYKRQQPWPGGYPVEMECVFYRKTKGKFDFSNMIESIQDLLVDAEIIRDDDFTSVYPVKPEVRFDKDHPRVVVTLTGPIE